MDYKTHFFTPNLGGNGGTSYSPHVAYLAHWGGGRRWSRVTGGRSRTTFFASKFFFLFSSSKTWCILWFSASYSPKNTVFIYLVPQLLPRQKAIVPWNPNSFQFLFEKEACLILQLMTESSGDSNKDNSFLTSTNLGEATRLNAENYKETSPLACG